VVTKSVRVDYDESVMDADGLRNALGEAGYPAASCRRCRPDRHGCLARHPRGTAWHRRDGDRRYLSENSMASIADRGKTDGTNELEAPLAVTA
jgi:hypothetical protein